MVQVDREGWHRNLVWLSGLWISPIRWLLLTVSSASLFTTIAVVLIGFALAPVPALVLSHRRRRRDELRVREASEEAERLRLQLNTVRYRTARLREELSAADRQARLSHQLTLLGQFKAGQTARYKEVAFQREAHGNDIRITGTIPATLADFKIEPPSLLAVPVKNEVPINVEVNWHPM